MARPSSKHPTELELEILKIIWREGPLAVREVRDLLAEKRDLAYTSVMTIMNIMTRKGYLKRTKQGRGFTYEAKISKQATSRGMLSDVVNRVFGGSAMAAMLNLLETNDLDDRELEELRTLIDQRTGSDAS